MSSTSSGYFRRLFLYGVMALVSNSGVGAESAWEETLQRLQSKQREHRIEALRSTHRFGEAAIPFLESIFLKDGSESHYSMFREERLLALNTLSHIPGLNAARVLVIAAGDLEKPVRDEARRLMLLREETQRDTVRSVWLYSDNWFVRQGALVALEEWGVAATELALGASLKVADRSDSQRTAAVQLLGQLESDLGIPALKALILADSEPLELRLEALGALHFLDAASVPLSAWTIALGDAGMRNLYQATLSGVHIAMSHLEAAGSHALPVLVKTLSDADPLKRMRAAYLLSKIGPSAAPAVVPLQMLARDSIEFVAEEARRSLARISQKQEFIPVASAPQIESGSDSVSVEDRGGVYRLANGLLQVEIDKAKGTVVSIARFGDGRNLFGEKGSWYHTFPWTLPRGMSVPIPRDVRAHIVRQSSDMAEVAVELSLEKPRPLRVEHHYVMRRGVSGIYRFAVMDKPAESSIPPDSIFDYALFMKVDARIFNRAAVSETLQGELERPEKVAGFQSQMRELSNATHRLPDGRIWAKYSWCAYEQETRLHGVSGDGVGLWVILPNDESGYNLPTCYPGTVHEAGESVVIVTHQEGTPHNIGSEQRARILNAPWQKTYGPVLLYVNAGPSHGHLWADAKKRAELEASAHPSSWLEHPLYPKERASVSGTVLAPDGKSAVRAWVMVCTPNPDPDRAWQRHLGPYLWRGWSDEEGRFSFGGIRPGKYSVIARVDGVLGVARRDEVVFSAGESVNVGSLKIHEERHGPRLWQIGIPDGTPKEFAGAVDSHEWSGWIRNYRRIFPGDVTFRVGRDDPRTGWYYCQPGGWPETYGGKSQPTRWKVQFDVTDVPPHGAVLTLGIAATRGGELKIACNEHELPALHIEESDYRSSRCMAPDRGAYYGFRTERIQIPASQLQSGNNELILRFGRGNSRFEAIMYDFLQMEAALPGTRESVP